jgi:uncharacterized protein YbjT (DUF2867 family)
VIVLKPGPLEASAERLLAGVAARGHSVLADAAALPAAEGTVTLAISDGPFVFDFLAFVRSLGERSFRVLMLSRLGVHPDARATTLRRLWRLEEHVRAGNAPTLTLRFAPLVGPASPLWQKLRSRPALPSDGRKLLNPVAESDAVETLAAALDGRALWRGWYEVAGPDSVSLAELRDIAAHTPGETAGGAWEPTLEEIAEHRLAECEPWASEFGITPTPLAAWTGAGAR